MVVGLICLALGVGYAQAASFSVRKNLLKLHMKIDAGISFSEYRDAVIDLKLSGMEDKNMKVNEKIVIDIHDAALKFWSDWNQAQKDSLGTSKFDRECPIFDRTRFMQMIEEYNVQFLKKMHKDGVDPIFAIVVCDFEKDELIRGMWQYADFVFKH